jgi:hypothetical protein
MIIHLLSVLRVLVENVWAKTQRCVKVNGCFHSLFLVSFFLSFFNVSGKSNCCRSF